MFSLKALSYFFLSIQGERSELIGSDFRTCLFYMGLNSVTVHVHVY